MTKKQCNKCHSHDACNDSSICVYCAERYCKACETSEKISGTNFCSDCKTPDKISLVCKGCGNGIQLSAEEAKKFFLLFKEYEKKEPELGQTLIVSKCNVCHHKKSMYPLVLEVC